MLIAFESFGGRVDRFSIHVGLTLGGLIRYMDLRTGRDVPSGSRVYCVNLQDHMPARNRVMIDGKSAFGSGPSEEVLLAWSEPQPLVCIIVGLCVMDESH